MSAKTLTTALVSAALLAGLFQSQAFANEGGGGGEAFHLRGPVVKERNVGRIQWRTNDNGTVDATDTGAPKKPAKAKRRKPKRIKWRKLPNGTVEAVDVGAPPRGPGNPRDHAISDDRDTGQRTGSFETGGGRLVISVGPLGPFIGLSMW